MSASQRGTTEVWLREAWMESSLRYHKMIQILSVERERYTAPLCTLVERSNLDPFADAIVHCFTKTNSTIAHIKTLLKGHYQSPPHRQINYNDNNSNSHHDNIDVNNNNSHLNMLLMREENVTTRLQRSLVLELCKPYLVRVLKGLIEQLVGDSSIWLEVDPRKIGLLYDPLGEHHGLDLDDILQTNQRHLIETAQVFFDRITSDRMIEAMPMRMFHYIYFILFYFILFYLFIIYFFINIY